jgi:sec-independent protein translocase protein TatA
MLEGLSPVHLIVILVIAVLILGPGKLPETGAALGKAMRDFRHAMNDDDADQAGRADPPGSSAPPEP